MSTLNACSRMCQVYCRWYWIWKFSHAPFHCNCSSSMEAFLKFEASSIKYSYSVIFMVGFKQCCCLRDLILYSTLTMQLSLAKYNMQAKCTWSYNSIDLTTAKGSLFDVINSTPSFKVLMQWKKQLKINSLSERTLEIIQKSKHSHAPTQLSINLTQQSIKLTQLSLNLAHCAVN